MKKALAVLAALTILVPLTWAQGPPGPGNKDEGRPDFKKRLGLSEEQLEQLDNIRHETELATIDVRAEIAKSEKKLQHELKKEKSDKSIIDNLINEIGELHAKMLRLRVDSLLKTKEILTPEQFKKFANRLKMWKGMGDGPGQGRPSGKKRK